MTEACQRPLGVGLLFASTAEIAATPAAEREAYYRIVENIVSAPEEFGLRPETPEDTAEDDRFDVGLAAANQDWG